MHFNNKWVNGTQGLKPLKVIDISFGTGSPKIKKIKVSVPVPVNYGIG